MILLVLLHFPRPDDPSSLYRGCFSDYHSYGAACVEVEVNCSDGDVTVTSADIVVDVGKSLNPAVDLGQIEGAFLQAVGYVTTEQLLTDVKTGQRGYILQYCNSIYKLCFNRKSNGFVIKNSIFQIAGQLVTASPSGYKIPTAADAPAHLRVSLLTEASGADPDRPASAVYSSKGVGEPPFTLGAAGVLMAAKEAVAARR